MRKRFRQDDRGIALISVMICVMLCFLLSATIMRVSFLSFLQKSVKKESVNAFYANEGYMDDLKAGLQDVAAHAIAASTTSSNKGIAFINSIESQIKTASGGTSITQAGVIAFLTNQLNKTAGGGKVKITSDASTPITVTKSADGKEILIKNVIIQYESFVDADNVSKNGYVSEVKTDIRFRAPFYELEEGGNSTTYSIVAANGATMADGQGSGRNQWGNLKQNGDIYIGYTRGTVTVAYEDAPANTKPYVAKASALTVKQHMSYWLTGDSVIINGDVNISDHSNFIFTGKKLEVRGTIYISDNSHLVLSTKNTSITCKDIVVGSKSVKGGEYGYPSVTATSGLPVDYDTSTMDNNNTSNSRYKWNNYAASIAIYDGNEQKGQGTLKNIGSLSETKVSFKDDAHPVSNVNAEGVSLSSKSALEGTGTQYDYELWKIVDVKTLNKFAGGSGIGNKNPKFFASSVNVKSDGSFDSIVKPGQLNGAEFVTIEGKKVGINVSKNNVQNINDTFGYFMIKWDDSEMNFGQLNGGGGYYGTFISKGQVTLTQAGALAVGKSLSEWCGSKNKTVLDYIGKGVMVENNGSGNESFVNNCINNFIKGGIKSLYTAQSNTGTKYTVKNSERNQNLDVISFENWEQR